MTMQVRSEGTAGNLRAVRFLAVWSVGVACTFTPPPPLPGEEGAGAAPGRAVGDAGEAGGGGPAPGEQAEGPAARAEGEGGEAPGDPAGGRFGLEEAFSGLSGEGDPWVLIHVDRGTLVCELFDDVAPVAVANFVGLARGLRPFFDLEKETWVRSPFYDGTIFHRVIPGFMIQGGDRTGTGTKGAGYTIPDEIRPDLRFDRPGRLAMAGRGPNTGSSQFFVTLAPASHLDGHHTIFGQCTDASVALADDMAMVPRGPDDRPKDPEQIRTIEVVLAKAAPNPSSGGQEVP